MAGVENQVPIPRVLRGSLITLRRRCGRAGCRCAQGDPHESPALSVSVAGRSRILTLAAADVPAVRAALERYRAASEQLEASAAAGVEALAAGLAARRRAAKGRRGSR